MLYLEELEAFGDMTFSDYRFNVGVLVSKNLPGEEPVSIELPESLGRFVTQIKNIKDAGAEIVSYPAVNCSDAFVLDVEPNSKMTRDVIPNGLCVDSNNTVLNGSHLAGLGKIAYFKL